MQNFSYNTSVSLKESLEAIESLREKILLSIVPPKLEKKLCWEAKMTRLFCSLNLAGNSLTRAQMENIITNPPKKLEPEAKEVLRYKNSLDYLAQNWLVSEENITTKTLVTLHDLYRPGKFRPSASKLKGFLKYFQVNPEHPVIQAAVAIVQLTALAPFTGGNGATARLMSYLIHYKHGYDFRGMLVVEKDWQKDPEIFRENMRKAIKGGNLTVFIEYFAEGIANHLRDVLHLLKTGSQQGEQTSSEVWDLNDRQKTILSYLEQPESTIGNRKVQKLFKISQITASRDLAKLTRLGLIFSHGKGRSVYYIKI